MKHQQKPTFSPKQKRAASLLASGLTVRATAAKIQVNVRTVHTWRYDAGFLKLVDSYQAKIIGRGLAQLAGAMTRAVGTLVACLKSDESDSVRVRAALGILDQVIRIRDSVDVERRLTEVERLMQRYVKP
jgi:hypothetical protein